MEKYSIEKHGITQGLLATWLSCRQKCRWYLQGYVSKMPSFPMTYGNVGHSVLEMVYKDIYDSKITSIPEPALVKRYIGKVEDAWRKDNPRSDKKALEYLELSLLIAEATLPLYFKYWIKDIKELRWVALEESFSVPYTAMDGRKTLIRGKRDGVFNNPKAWLFENKFKSQINEADLVDTLPFDLQIMLYTWSLKRVNKILPSGVLYNIIRRTGLKQKEKESIQEYSVRIVEDIKTRPEWYFLRMEISISPEEMTMFEGELEDMIIDFMDWWEGITGHYRNSGHCINKYGRCTYLGLCANKNFSLYTKRPTIFTELEEA